jgi:putative PIG3 family NAD(P)H quinone oxidoreductase
MHAIVITEPGDENVLRWQQVPDPEPGPGEVLVKVTASAVNRADLMQRQGFYDPPPGASPYPGLECSGEIIALGREVTGWRAGDQVAALLSGGGYATHVAVPAGQLLPIPAGLTTTQAAALPEATCTVYSNVFMLAGLQAGELFLVHGGSSGIGTMAIQLAKAAGARVACTASSDEKLLRCRELGADITINYRTSDFVAAVREHGGADVILDIMGASYLDRNLNALAVNGRLAIIGMQGGVQAGLNLGLMMARRAVISATTLRARPVAEKQRIVQAVLDNVWPLAASGQVRPVIDAELPMPEAARAQRMMAESGHVGKILLLVPHKLGA